METTELALTIYLTFLTTGLSALFWTRMNRLEKRMDRIEERMATKEDLAEVRSEMGNMRSDMGSMRSEMGIMRSDLTHVALAVGAKPRASGD